MDTINKPYKIYSENTEQGTLDQFKNVMSQDWVLRGALLPDAHLGFCAPIGCVTETLNTVSPVFVGADIGCGCCAQLTSFDKDVIWANRFSILKALHEEIPVGYKHQQTPQTWVDFWNIPKTLWFEEMFYNNGGFNQIGTLGGNNHHLEIGYDQHDMIWITIHSGSRGIGKLTADHYISMAHPEGKINNDAHAFDVNSQVGKDYIMDMQLCLAFALENREHMINTAIKVINKFTFGTPADFFINRTHNHAESKDGVHWIHRKGATHAELGMQGVIPGNFRDGSFIVVGKGNPESLYSSSHGAGRVMGRKAAERLFTLEQVRASVGDVAINIGKKQIEESPEAYKNIFEVMRLQKDLVDVTHHIKPIICVKG